MSTPLKYRFYAFDTTLKVELNCFLFFDVNSLDFGSDFPSLVLDLSSHTPADLAQLAFDYFHEEYSINIDRVSISAFLNTIKIWAVDSKGFAHFAVVSMND